ncbi:MAG: glycosyltransferase [Verrucomicrobia bacterium]|nr:glycosyltransferase [Verrucomicrobiota bacterium]
MNPEKIISVVIPARNAASTIAALLRSLLPDAGLIKEILLVDDGSGDATVEIAKNSAERYGLPLFILPAACGTAGAARNFGIAQAQGKFLFFMDADDELISGALTILAGLLIENPAAGLAIGACIRQTASRQDKIKIPHGYTEDCDENVIRYLANELWPIAMGSAMIVTAQAAGIRFPETIGLDEDTCYWTALLTRVRVVTSAEPVLIYKLDEARMSRRYISAPRKTLLGIARAFRILASYGIPDAALKQRIAWVALRIARQLIIDRQYSEAEGILRLVRAHPCFRPTVRVFRYNLRIKVGGIFQRLGVCKPVVGQRAVEVASRSRRTLLVTVDSASPPVSGADLRNHQNAKSLGKLGRVRVVSIRPGGSERIDHNPQIEFFSVGVLDERSKSLSSRRCSVETRISRTALSRLLETIRDFRPDTILVEGIPLAALLKPVRSLTKCLILDMHNIESDLASQRQTVAFRKDAARVRRLEKKSLKRVDRIWVCSEQDRERLIALHQPSASIHVVPNCIPGGSPLRSECQPRIQSCEKSPVMLFVGHLGYWPNVAAAERLARGILPNVRETFPAAKVILTGRYPDRVVQSLAGLPGVELHANPESLVPFYERAHVAVVPLSEGGGTRIKVLEAMAVGLPVVATAVAVEGLGLVEHEDVLLADSDEDLARHIVELCRNPNMMLKQILSANKTARLRFGSEAVDFAVKNGFQ